MLELMIGITLLVLGVLGYLRVAAESTATGQMTAEHGIALEAARQHLERLKSIPLDTVVALYDADPNNDPAGVGTAPGPRFQIDGLPQSNAEADGWQGRVELPIAGGAVREDIDDAGLGMPRDLNLDGAIDGLDHSGDYRMLPVRVRVQWNGVRGEASVQLRSILGAP